MNKVANSPQTDTYLNPLKNSGIDSLTDKQKMVPKEKIRLVITDKKFCK